MTARAEDTPSEAAGKRAGSARDEVERLLRPDLRGRTAYGAPQLDVPVALNTNESSYPVPPVVVRAALEALEADLSGLNRYPDREFTDLRKALTDYLEKQACRLHRLALIARMHSCRREQSE